MLFFFPECKLGRLKNSMDTQANNVTALLLRQCDPNKQLLARKEGILLLITLLNQLLK